MPPEPKVVQLCHGQDEHPYIQRKVYSAMCKSNLDTYTVCLYTGVKGLPATPDKLHRSPHCEVEDENCGRRNYVEPYSHPDNLSELLAGEYSQVEEENRGFDGAKTRYEHDLP